MFGSTVLEVAIGLAFVYLLLSLLCTTVNEWIAGIFRLRSKTLEEGIRRLLHSEAGDPNSLAEKLYNHPLINALTRKGRKPSYMAPKTFAAALTDVLGLGRGAVQTFEGMTAAIGKIQQENVRKSLQAIANASENKIDAFQKGIETWYDETMDRVSGWYKRKIHIITLCVAVVVVIFANADTLQILARLWTEPTLRAAVVEQAKVRERTGPNWEYSDPNSPIPTAPVDKSQEQKKNTGASGLTEEEQELLGQLVGWPADFKMVQAKGGFFGWVGWLVSTHFFGWLLSAIAVSFGAPFWFDALKKLVNLRMSGQSPAEKQEKATA